MERGLHGNDRFAPNVGEEARLRVPCFQNTADPSRPARRDLHFLHGRAEENLIYIHFGGLAEREDHRTRKAGCRDCLLRIEVRDGLVHAFRLETEPGSSVSTLPGDKIVVRRPSSFTS